MRKNTPVIFEDRRKVWSTGMKELVLREKDYKETMDRVVLPYLKERQAQLWLERERGRKLYCMRYRAEQAAGVVLISHGFTESAEKYREVIYYFLKNGFHVYCMEHCGHGHSYRLVEDLSLVHIDRYERYVEDLLFVAGTARKENAGLPLYLYAHSMGGGIGAAAAAREPGCFAKLVLTSPMIRPETAPVPWGLARLIADICCFLGKEKEYVMGQKPYEGLELFAESASTSEVRFAYYQERRKAEPLYQINAPSYGWLRSAGRMNRYLRSKGWKQISVPVLLFQAERDDFVSLQEQERFIRKLSGRGEALLVKTTGTKHEIYNADETVLEDYWERVFGFLKK
ncbi:MAG: alpha/beta hydrolase [Ruminococcus flavefaciens]|nr:alpha/beta hydrolase [Blautia sp.]MCM1236775.1 alpha/beta hydrolase [Ruminococcus flavefaciens]